MQATLDISLYPLQDNYKEVIVGFVKTMWNHAELRVETDGMRTQIVGDYDILMSALTAEIREVLLDNKAVFILKLAKGERTLENLTEALRT